MEGKRENQTGKTRGVGQREGKVRTENVKESRLILYYPGVQRYDKGTREKNLTEERILGTLSKWGKKGVCFNANNEAKRTPNRGES